MSKPSPTSRSLAHLRKEGYTAVVVESFDHMSCARRDFLGIIDIVAMGHGHILGVQTTTDSHLATRRTKALREPRLEAWLGNGGRFVLHGWKQAKNKRWVLRAEEISLDRHRAAPKPDPEDHESICPTMETPL